MLIILYIKLSTIHAFYKPEKSSAVYIIIYLFVFYCNFSIKNTEQYQNDVINQPTEIERKLNKKVERCMFHSKIKTKRLPWIMLTRKRSCS